MKVAVFGSNGTLRIGGSTLSANTLLHLYAPGSNGMIDFVGNTTLNSSGTAAVIAANTVTIENGVVVTIGGSPANVFANVANYSARDGGNNSTTGTFAGAGATTPSLWVVGRRLTAPAHDSQQKNKLDQLGREEEWVTPSISLIARNWDHSSKMPALVGMAKSGLHRPPSRALHPLAMHPHKPHGLLMLLTDTTP